MNISCCQNWSEMNEQLVDKKTAKRLKLAKNLVSARFQLLVWVTFGTYAG